VSWRCFGEGRRPQSGRKLGLNRVPPTCEQRQLGGADIVREAGAHLHGDQRGDVMAFGGELMGEREKGRRLACLARSVDDEVTLLLDETAQFRQAP
jgi:hypothetical protein